MCHHGSPLRKLVFLLLFASFSWSFTSCEFFNNLTRPVLCQCAPFGFVPVLRFCEQAVYFFYIPLLQCDQGRWRYLPEYYLSNSVVEVSAFTCRLPVRLPYPTTTYLPTCLLVQYVVQYSIHSSILYYTQYVCMYYYIIDVLYYYVLCCSLFVSCPLGSSSALPYLPVPLRLASSALRVWLVLQAAQSGLAQVPRFVKFLTIWLGQVGKKILPQ